MPLIAAYYERWSGRLAARLGINAAVQTTPDIADFPGERSTPARPIIYGREQFRRQPQLGWQRQNDEAAVVQPDVPPQTPVRRFLFAEFKRAPAIGWQESGPGQSESTSLSWRATQQWKPWNRQPRLGWSAPSEQDTNLEQPGPSWQAVKPWTNYRRQPWLGLTTPTDEAAAVVSTPGDAVAIQAIAYYERWSGRQAALQVLNAAPPIPFVQPSETPLATVARPFLFKGYRRQPWLGQSSPHQEPQLVDAAWRPTRQWAKWLPQPQLGWQQAPNDQDTNLEMPGLWQHRHPYLFRVYSRQPILGWAAPSDQDESEKTPGPSWQATKPWSSYRRQPWLGQITPTDAFVAAPSQPGPSAALHPFLFCPFSRQPWLGFSAPNDQDTNEKTPGPSWQATRQWIGWRRQPWLGFNGSPDTAVTPTTPDAPAQALRPFLGKEYKRQPQLGWSVPGQEVPPAGVEWRPTRQWSAWAHQPQLGWQQAAGDQDISAKAPPVAWATTRQWSRWNPQPRLGWTPATDTVQEVLEGGPTISLRPYRFGTYAPQPRLGWATPANFEAPAVFKEPFMVVPPRPYLFKPYKLQPWLGWANYGFESSVAFAVEFPVGVGRPVRRISGRGLATAPPAYAEAFGRVRLHGEGLAVAVAAYTETIGRLRYHATGSVGVEPARSRASGVIAEPGQWIIVVDGDDDFTIIAG